MVKLKVVTLGDSTGVVLPEELLARLRVERGDTLFAIETPTGIELTAHDPELGRQLKIAEDVMREDHSALRRLAG